MSQRSKVYFPGLNALRFFAAFAVIVTHVELMKKYIGFKNSWVDIWPKLTDDIYTPIQGILAGEFSWYQPFIAEAGPLGVTFFFVLSGFLITYLLFVEKKEKGRIKIRAFYARRVFRIWPLYYLVFVLGFFILPCFETFHVPIQQKAIDDHFWMNFWCYLIILPNLALALFNENSGAVPNIGQSWSIGVEEQFYLIWPWFIRHTRRPFKVLIGSALGIVVFKGVFWYLWWKFPSHSMTVFKDLLVMSKIECMAMGGIGAYILFFNKEKMKKFLFHPVIQVLAYISIPLMLWFTHVWIQNGVHMLYGTAFLIIIMNISSNPNSVVKLEYKWLNFLGNISYGVYMYHLMVVVAILNLAKRFGFEKDTFTGWKDVALYIVVCGLTVLISHLSYRYFEKYFIKLKKRFTRVVSGEAAKEE